MFYIHGGGYSFGSSYELPSHEGAQMVRHHDVVQVSVNHRLNILGFFDVSKIGGSAYDDSANVGMTDLVVALEWVRDNIENFGGDLECRTLARPLQHRQTTLLAGISIAGTRGVADKQRGAWRSGNRYRATPHTPDGGYLNSEVAALP